MQRYLVERANKLSQEVDARTDLLALREILEPEGVSPTEIWRVGLGSFHYINTDGIHSALVTIVKQQPVKKTLFNIV